MGWPNGLGDPQDRRRRAARELPDDDVVALLLRQHADIVDLLEQLENAAGDQRRQSFTALRALLEAREAVAPSLVDAGVLDASTAAARRQDHERILSLLRTMSALDVDSLGFSDLSEELVALVSSTVDAEQDHDLALLDRLPTPQRAWLGARLREVASAWPGR